MAITPVNLPLSLMTSLNPIQNISEQPAQTDFAKMLGDALQKMDNVQKDADNATLQLATGQTQDVHNTMIALEKANLTFSLAVEVRDKVLAAYQEAMRMQL